MIPFSNPASEDRHIAPASCTSASWRFLSVNICCLYGGLRGVHSRPCRYESALSMFEFLSQNNFYRIAASWHDFLLWGFDLVYGSCRGCFYSIPRHDERAVRGHCELKLETPANATLPLAVQCFCGRSDCERLIVFSSGLRQASWPRETTLIFERGVNRLHHTASIYLGRTPPSPKIYAVQRSYLVHEKHLSLTLPLPGEECELMCANTKSQIA